MKRPYLIYILIALQCVTLFALATMHIAIDRGLAVQQGSADQLVRAQIALRQQIGVLAASSRQATYSTEAVGDCEPSSIEWSVYEDRRIQDESACWIERFQRRMQRFTCTSEGQQTSQDIQPLSDWTFLRSYKC